MTFKTLLSILVSFLLLSSGAGAVTVIESGGKSTVIESRTSATANSGGNGGSGDIVTGSATATSTTEVRSSDGETKATVEAVSEADGKKTSVSATQEGPGTVSVGETGDGTEASVDLSVSDGSPSDVPSAGSGGIFGKVGAFFSEVGDFIRSIFE